MRKPGFWEEDRLSFLLQLGCEELTASCKMRWLSCGTHVQGGQFFLFLSGNFPQELGFIPPNCAECGLLNILGGKTWVFVFFFSFTLDIGLFSLAFKDLDNIPLQIFPISTMSFRKPSPLMEDNTVPAGG